jgi:DNA-binding response OmpR family regulator
MNPTRCNNGWRFFNYSVMNSLFTRNELKRPGRQCSPTLKTCPPAVLLNNFASLSVFVDWTRREICHRGGRRCRLSTREAALLACLVRKAGTPVSRDEILLQVWQLDPLRTATRTIDMHISLLRRKLDDDADRPSVLISVRGVGYMLHRGVLPLDDLPPSAGAAGRLPWEVTTGMEPLSTL